MQVITLELHFKWNLNIRTFSIEICDVVSAALRMQFGAAEQKV